MSLAFNKLRTYFRLTLMIAVAIVVVLVLFKNRNHQVTVWFFREYQEINVVWLLIVTGVGSVMAAWLTRGIFQVIRDVKRYRMEEESQRIVNEHESKARELLEQEKRIDEKLKSALGEENKEAE